MDRRHSGFCSSQKATEFDFGTVLRQPSTSRAETEPWTISHNFGNRGNELWVLIRILFGHVAKICIEETVKSLSCRALKVLFSFLSTIQITLQFRVHDMKEAQPTLLFFTFCKNYSIENNSYIRRGPPCPFNLHRT